MRTILVLVLLLNLQAPAPHLAVRWEGFGAAVVSFDGSGCLSRHPIGGGVHYFIGCYPPGPHALRLPPDYAGPHDAALFPEPGDRYILETEKGRVVTALPLHRVALPMVSSSNDVNPREEIATLLASPDIRIEGQGFEGDAVYTPPFLADNVQTSPSQGSRPVHP